MARPINELLGSSSFSRTPAEAEAAPQVTEVEQPAPPEVEAETPPAQPPEAATGEINQGEPPSPQTETPPIVDDRQIAAFKRKAEDETRKRQEYEKQLNAAQKEALETKALLQRFMQQQQVQQQPRQQQQRPPAPDPEIDPVAAFAYQSQLFSEALAARDEAIVDTRVLMSQEMMRTKPDYEEMEAVFAEEVDRAAQQGDLTLWRQMRSHPMPARFAYETGRRIKLAREMGDDPDAYMQSRIDAAVAEALAAQGLAAQPVQPRPAPQAPTQKSAPPPPKTLAGVTSQTPRNISKVWDGPRPVSDILAPKQTR